LNLTKASLPEWLEFNCINMLSPQERQRMAARFVAACAALGLSAQRTGADGMGAQHSTAGGLTLFHHVPKFSRAVMRVGASFSASAARSVGTS
jgi:hypothetical protein